MSRPSSLLAFLICAITAGALGAQASTVVLVRHAEKAAPTGDPYLSDAGQRRAGRLAKALDRFRLSPIPAGSADLVVGHSNTLGPLIATPGGPNVPDLCDGEYATVLVLDLPGGGSPPWLLRASYGRADPGDGLDCHDDMQMRQ